jgi:hypothetical protein
VPIGALGFPATLRVAYNESSTNSSIVSRADLLMVTGSSCLSEGQFTRRGGDQQLYCTDCPDGGHCPGGTIISLLLFFCQTLSPFNISPLVFRPSGGRVYPRSSFWSFNEWSAPVRCANNGFACPGSLGEHPDYPLRLNEDGTRDTRRCIEGYSGDFCSDCLPGYWKSEMRCLPCGDESERAQLLAVLVSSLFLFFALAIAVIVLSSRWLSLVVGILVFLQQFAQLGKVCFPISLSLSFPVSIRFLFSGRAPRAPSQLLPVGQYRQLPCHVCMKAVSPFLPFFLSIFASPFFNQIFPVLFLLVSPFLASFFQSEL